MCLKRITNMIIETMGRRRTPETYTKVLLHFDGVNGSTTFIDETGRAWTKTGSANITNSFVKFGIGSLNPGIGKIITPSSEDFAFGTENFTIDFWTYLGNNQVVITLDSTVAIGNYGIYYNMNDNRCYLYYNGTQIYSSGDNAFSFHGWKHIAIIGINSTIKIYFDGSLFHSTTVNYNIAENDLSIHGNDFQSAAPIDEFRISNIARWTSNFTPPTSAYTLD